jgi:cell division protein FtsB
MADGKNQRTKKPRSRSVTAMQFLVIILITVALAVVLDFGHRAAMSAELKREARRLEREVATLEAEHRELEAQQEWVATDGYVEEWARTEGGMVMRGETPVVPVPTGPDVTAGIAASAPVSDSNTAAPEQVEGERSHWQEWWDLFFGPSDEPTEEDGGE